MQGGLSKIMTTLSELWKSFHLLSDPQALSEQERTFLLCFLSDEARLREQKRIEHLMRMSGIKRVKRLSDFDWTFNPKVPKDKIMPACRRQGVCSHPVAQTTLQSRPDRSCGSGQNPSGHR